MIDALFVYGTLRDAVLVEGLIGRSPQRTPAVLRGWRCEFLRGRPFPGIAPDAGGHVRGELLLGLLPEELARLDRYEGGLYERLARSVEAGEATSAEAWIYALRAEHRGLLDGRAWPGAQAAAGDR